MGAFAIDVARFVAKAKGNTDLVVRKICFDIFSRVIKKTPVDKGRAKGNWAVAIGQPAPATDRPFDKSGQRTIADMKTFVNDQMQAGKIIYLTNTLPYILRLEEGYSRKAPAGMVALTLREFPGVVRDSTAGLP